MNSECKQVTGCSGVSDYANEELVQDLLPFLNSAALRAHFLYVYRLTSLGQRVTFGLASRNDEVDASKKTTKEST